MLIRVALEPASKTASYLIIFVAFVIVRGKICRNVLLNLKRLEVSVSFGSLGGA